MKAGQDDWERSVKRRSAGLCAATFDKDRKHILLEGKAEMVYECRRELTHGGHCSLVPVKAE